MFDKLRRDCARYPERWFTSTGFWIIAVYRLGMWAHSLPSPFLRIPVWVLYRLARLPFLPFNVSLWAGAGGARIAPGLVLLHPTNVMISRGVEIGEDCLIFHDVTLGTGPIPGVPKIGRNVDIYVGARVLGGVTIGDESMIGANCVVMRDVPPRSVVLAPAARVIPRTLSPFASAADRRQAESDDSQQASA